MYYLNILEHPVKLEQNEDNSFEEEIGILYIIL